MKKYIMLFVIAFIINSKLHAQSPVRNGLWLELDANIGFTPATYGTYVPARWVDQSQGGVLGSGNDLYSGPVTGSSFSNPPQLIGDPTFVANAQGSGRNAIYFDGNDYMQNLQVAYVQNQQFPLTPAPPYPAALGFTTADNVTEATLFVVRIAPSGIQSVSGCETVNTLVSIQDVNNYGSAVIPPYPTNANDNEFALMRDWAIHSGYPGCYLYSSAFSYRDHQCFSATPWYRPVVMATQLGQNPTDIEYFINGVQSTNPVQTAVVTAFPNPPTTHPYSNVDRCISVGSRHNIIGWPSMNFTGYILEVLAYNRRLTAAETQQVNDYLKCKYEVFYASCNTPSPCQCFNSPRIDINHVGTDANGNCMFNADIYAAPTAGTNFFGLEITEPGKPPVFVPASTVGTANPYSYPFTIIAPGGNDFKVRALAFKNNWNPNEDPCCDYRMRKEVWCDGGDYWGIGQKIPKTIQEKENESEEIINIYPNPTDKYINIKTKNIENYNVVITDIIGKIIIKEIVKGESHSISLDGNLPGLYLVQLMDEEGRVLKTEKVILQ